MTLFMVDQDSRIGGRPRQSMIERLAPGDARVAIADTWRQAMLPRLPHIDGYHLAARYLPADDVGKVGGDWYDAVSATDGRLTLVIGDVAGHDAVAAARMSELRCMLRAFVLDRRESPAGLLRRLDAANHALGEPIMATSAVVVVDRISDGSYRLCWSNAGHPPPLIITSDRSVRTLPGHDMLLGACPDVARRTYTRRVPAGSIVLLHTDGLVEDRGRHIDDGFEALHQRLRGSVATGLDGLLDDAVGMVQQKRADDIALLVVRIGG
jgi:sigma-B regulation protein RsbU (phosphoserine phosphatase)